MSERTPETWADFVHAIAQRAAESVKRLQLKQTHLDCPACGAAMVWRQVTDFRCHGCQATWTYVRGKPGPTMQERRRVQATGLPPWWLAPSPDPDPDGGSDDERTPTP